MTEVVIGEIGSAHVGVDVAGGKVVADDQIQIRLEIPTRFCFRVDADFEDGVFHGDADVIDTDTEADADAIDGCVGGIVAEDVPTASLDAAADVGRRVPNDLRQRIIHTIRE